MSKKRDQYNLSWKMSDAASFVFATAVVSRQTGMLALHCDGCVTFIGCLQAIYYYIDNCTAGLPRLYPLTCVMSYVVLGRKG